MLFTLTHECANRCWCAVENRDLQLFHDRPPAIPCGRVGSSLVHHLRRAVGERSVNDIGVAGDPTDIGGTPVGVVGLDVKHILVGEGGTEQVARTRVHDPFRLRRRAARVEQEEELLCRHRIGGARCNLRINEVAPPVVAAGVHCRLAARLSAAAAIDKNAGDRWGTAQCLIGDGLQFEECPLPVSPVGGDEYLRLGIVDAICECIGREAAKDHAMRCTKARAGEHGDRNLGHHRHIDRHSIALLYAERLQGVRRLLHLAVEIVVGDRAAIAWLTHPVERDALTAASGNVAVDTVLGDVQRAVGKPGGKWELPFEGLGERGSPGEQGARLVGPEGLGICRCLSVELCGGVRRGGRGGVWREGEAFGLERLDPRPLLAVRH